MVGYLDFSGNLDTAIAIRTMLVAPDGRASVQAGAGIVADSDPAKEDLECPNKAAALLASVPRPRRRMTAARAGRARRAAVAGVPASAREAGRGRDGGRLRRGYATWTASRVGAPRPRRGPGGRARTPPPTSRVR